MTKDLKLKLYPAVIGVMGLCLVALLLSRVQIQVWTESSPPEDLPPPGAEPITELSPPVPLAPPAYPPPPLPPEVTIAPSPPALDLVPPVLPETAPPPQPGTNFPEEEGVRQGSFRVSNQSRYPVRVALLPLQPKTAGVEESIAASPASIAFGQPVHWDFAPGEGRTRGLLLSLPNGDLQLQPGDVLMAFAQDGSRRYWGPYVVGQTRFPQWNRETREWQLILQP